MVELIPRPVGRAGLDVHEVTVPLYVGVIVVMAEFWVKVYDELYVREDGGSILMVMNFLSKVKFF